MKNKLLAKKIESVPIRDIMSRLHIFASGQYLRNWFPFWLFYTKTLIFDQRLWRISDWTINNLSNLIDSVYILYIYMIWIRLEKLDFVNLYKSSRFWETRFSWNENWMSKLLTQFFRSMRKSGMKKINSR